MHRQHHKLASISAGETLQAMRDKVPDLFVMSTWDLRPEYSAYVVGLGLAVVVVCDGPRRWWWRPNQTWRPGLRLVAVVRTAIQAKSMQQCPGVSSPGHTTPLQWSQSWQSCCCHNTLSQPVSTTSSKYDSSLTAQTEQSWRQWYQSQLRVDQIILSCDKLIVKT